MKTIIKIIIAIFLIIITILLIFGVSGYQMYKQAIEEKPISDKIISIKEEKENYTEFDKLPEFYVDAVIATEDHRFYEHNGIDIIGIGRAIFTDIKKKSLSEGGSTITQQLAKNIYFTQERTSKRKIAEIFMASSIEKECSKEDILELYANTSYFGGGYYTIKDASLGYFKKELEDLTEYECAMLAGIPNAPSVYNPKVNPNLAEQRTEQVLRKMVLFGYITQEKMDNILEKE